MYEIESTRQTLFHSGLTDEIEVILERIMERCIKPNNTSFYGLLEGNSGVSLFCANYWLYQSKEANEEILQNKLQSVIDNGIHTDYLVSSLATGYTGIAFVFKNLVDNGLLDQEDIPYLAEIHPLIIDSLETDFKSEDYSLLYGAIGKGIYLLKEPAKNKQAIASIVQYLSDTAIVNEDNQCWWYRKNGSYDSVIVLGQAYGLSSIILFLLKCYLNDIQKERCQSLIESTISFILAQKKKSKRAMYPSTIGEEPERANRLAWCYGDLNIAFVLFKCATVFNNNDYSVEAALVLNSCLERNLLTSYVNFEEQNNVYDPGFCHGTAGVAYIFKRLYQLSGNKEAERAAIEWLNYTLLSCKVKLENKSELAATINVQGTPFTKSFYSNLITGYAGIGLVLLDFLDSSTDWNELFQLD